MNSVRDGIGTGVDAVANVGVKNGRIAAITTEQISGRETIDASGLPASQIDAH